jgi:Zn-dependent protease with chaperone function
VTGGVGMERTRLTGLRPQSYEHPLDTKALDALHKAPGLKTLVKKCNEWGLERLLRVQLTGSNLRVTADSFSEIYEQVLAAADILDLPRLPEVYIAGGDINAFTAGVEHPILVLTSGAIDGLTENELFFVIAHELGHIKSGHVLYYQIAQFLPVLGDIVGGITFGIGELVSAGVQVALLNWQRMSEFTADRAGLLATQDVNVTISAMAKLAGLPMKYREQFNIDDFIRQAKDFQALDYDTLSWVAKGLSVMGETHPWTVMRANQFLAWVDSGEYERVLTAEHDAMPVTGQSFCTQCGRALNGVELFCPGCGTKCPQAAVVTG